MNTNEHNDDDILKDGEKMTVSIAMMDAATARNERKPRGIITNDHWQKARLATAFRVGITDADIEIEAQGLADREAEAKAHRDKATARGTALDAHYDARDDKLSKAWLP